METSFDQYVVDAFTDQVFAGNTAAVCLLPAPWPADCPDRGPDRCPDGGADGWPAEALMQAIAIENRFSETAFLLSRAPGVYDLRWFAPGGEVDLCGHGTLASGYVVLTQLEPQHERVTFHTRKSGALTVRRLPEGRLEMELPAYALTQVPVTEAMTQAIGARPQEAWMGRDLVCVMAAEEEVAGAAPDMDRVKALDGFLLHLTAAGKEHDCVTRSFGPKLAVPEDPVCGSGHCHVAPFWMRRLGRSELVARQASARGGMLWCRMEGDRVFLGGQAALFAKGVIFVPVAAPSA